MGNLAATALGAALFLAFAARERLLPKSRRYIMENPNDIGYIFGRDPLLDVMSEREWREIESRVEPV